MAEKTALSFVYDTVEYCGADGDSAVYAEITGYTGHESELEIPDLVDGITVKSIGRGAFANCTFIKSVFIPDTVRDICFDAFSGCTELENVNIPKSTTYIGNRAFMGCTSLKFVKLHQKIELIGDKAFGYTDASSKTEGFTIICKKQSVGYRYAKANRFAYEKTGMIVSPFRYTLESVYDSASDEIVKYACITSYCGNDQNVIVPAEIDGYAVKIIDGCAFAETSVRTVIVSEGMEKILSGAFRGCKKLESVFLPETLAYIGSYAFNGCLNLNKISVPQNAEVCSLAFDTCA